MDQSPLYVRWIPDNCPYALEMQLDLITRLKSELDQSEAAGVEIGGVFVGMLPTQDSPTLRLDDVIIVPAGNVPEFMLAPDQVSHLADMSAESRMSGRPFAGFFRSHLRDGFMAPTAVDVAAVAPQFPEGVFAFLLIGPLQGVARQAAFFLAMRGQLSSVPSSPPFAFDERTFQSLPEVPAEFTEDIRKFKIGGAFRRPPLPWPALLSFGLVLFLICTWTMGSRISQLFRPASNQIDLTVVRSGPNLKITWDHSSPILNKALGATIVIMDGPSHRELKLDSDDLKLGQVSYSRLTRKVYVVMSVDAPGTKMPVQTFDWTSN